MAQKNVQAAAQGKASGSAIKDGAAAGDLAKGSEVTLTTTTTLGDVTNPANPGPGPFGDANTAAGELIKSGGTLLSQTIAPVEPANPADPKGGPLGDADQNAGDLAGLTAALGFHHVKMTRNVKIDGVWLEAGQSGTVPAEIRDQLAALDAIEKDA